MISETEALASMRAALESEGNELHEQLRADLGNNTLLWLALPPTWTTALADWCRFPASNGLDLVLDRAAAASLIQRRATIGPGGAQQVFWVPPAQRDDVLTRVVTDIGPTAVTRVAVDIADAVVAAEKSGVDVPPSMRTWANLVQRAQDPEQLVLDVKALVEQDDLATASDLIVAAEGLEPLLDARWGIALVRSRRVVHLGYRQRQDHLVLEAFVRRSEQIAPLVDFVRDPSTKAWALSLLGVGGVGKTMLLRYLSSGLLADEHGLPRFPVARADFDHIKPDYPVRSPVQLLLELVDELAPFASADAADRSMSVFLSLATSAHAAAASREVLPSDDALVTDAISAFARFLTILSQPVVLVLDTCEELAKLHPVGMASPAIERTFAIIEQVRELAPSTLVIMAGRRYLAKAGVDWTAPVAAGEAIAQLDGKPYLRKVELRGFDEEEARHYLRAPTPPLPDPLIDKVLELSPEPGQAGSDRSRAVARYNPFDLNLYRGWFEVAPDLNAESLVTVGSDAYVDARIVARLHDRAVTALLPAVALLGRFDADVLEPLARSIGVDVEAVIDRLAEQEWIDTDLDPSRGTRVLAVEDQLVPRLRVWANSPANKDLLDDTRARLADTLRGKLRHAGFGELGVHHVLGALRCTPTEGAAIWTELEARVAAERSWAWMRNVVSRVRGELAEPSEAEWADNPVLQAAVHASDVAVRLRDEPLDDYTASWHAITRLVSTAVASGDPVATRLAARARLGLYASSNRILTPDEIIDLATIIGERGGPPEAIVAAVEAVVDATAPAMLGDLLDPLAAFCTDTRIPTDIRAASAAAGARVARANQLGAGDFLFIARELAGSAAPTSLWVDWVGHDDLPSWVLLHVVRQAHVDGVKPSEVPLSDWYEHSRRHLSTIDGERLASACVQYELGWTRIERQRLDELAAEDRYDPRRRPLRLMHEGIPPLVVALAEGYLALGDAERSMNIVQDRRDDARGQRLEDATVRHTDRAVVQLIRRLRLRDTEGSKLLRTRELPDPPGPDQVSSVVVDDYELAWSVAVLLDGASPPPSPTVRSHPALWHAWFRSQIALDAAAADFDTGWLAWPHRIDTILDGRLEADAREVAAPGMGATTAVDPWQLSRHDLADPRLLSSYGPVLALMVEPRWLEGKVIDRAASSDSAINAPPRDAARAALEHAELTALRRPDLARPLFAFAKSATDDPIIQFMADTLDALTERRQGEGPLKTPPSPPEVVGPMWGGWQQRADVVAARSLPARGTGVSAELSMPRAREPVATPTTEMPVAAQPVAAASSAPVVAAYTPSSVSGARDISSLIVSLITIAVGVAIGVTVAVGFYMSGQSNWVKAAVSLAGVVAALPSFFVSVRRQVLRGKLRGLYELKVTVAAGTASAERAGLTVTADVSPVLHGWATRARVWICRRVAITHRVPRVEAALSTRGPVKINRLRLPKLTDWAESTDSFVAAGLGVPTSLADLDWEQMLSQAVDEPTGWRLVWWRRRSVSRRMSGALWRRSGVVVVCDPSNQPPSLGTFRPRSDRSSGARVLHVVGRCEVTGNEALLNTAPYTSASPVATPRRNLYGVEDLGSRFSAVVLLQGIPTTSKTGYREPSEASGALRFSRDLANNSFGHIVSIPALPVDVATKVIEVMGSVAGERRPPRRRELVATAGRIKQVIVEAGDSAGWAVQARLLAADVLLFLSDERTRDGDR